MSRSVSRLVGTWLMIAAAAALAEPADPERDILVTFDNRGAEVSSPSAAPPYRFRKRYAISSAVRRLSR